MARRAAAMAFALVIGALAVANAGVEDLGPEEALEAVGEGVGGGAGRRGGGGGGELSTSGSFTLSNRAGNSEGMMLGELGGHIPSASASKSHVESMGTRLGEFLDTATVQLGDVKGGSCSVPDAVSTLKLATTQNELLAGRLLKEWNRLTAGQALRHAAPSSTKQCAKWHRGNARGVVFPASSATMQSGGGSSVENLREADMADGSKKKKSGKKNRSKAKTKKAKAKKAAPKKKTATKKTTAKKKPKAKAKKAAPKKKATPKKAASKKKTTAKKPKAKTAKKKAAPKKKAAKKKAAPKKKAAKKKAAPKKKAANKKAPKTVVKKVAKKVVKIRSPRFFAMVPRLDHRSCTPVFDECRSSSITEKRVDVLGDFSSVDANGCTACEHGSYPFSHFISYTSWIKGKVKCVKPTIGALKTQCQPSNTTDVNERVGADLLNPLSCNSLGIKIVLERAAALHYALDLKVACIVWKHVFCVSDTDGKRRCAVTKQATFLYADTCLNRGTDWRNPVAGKNGLLQPAIFDYKRCVGKAFKKADLKLNSKGASASKEHCVVTCVGKYSATKATALTMGKPYPCKDGASCLWKKLPQDKDAPPIQVVAASKTQGKEYAGVARMVGKYAGKAAMASFVKFAKATGMCSNAAATA